MKKIRRLHLWIGLLTSVLILMEAITGLLMVEPWLMGADKPALEQRVQPQKTQMAAEGEIAQREGLTEGPEADRNFSPPGQGSSAMGFVKGLHSGRIGNTDVSFILDIAAIVLIILTTTGIILSIRVLRAQSGGRRKT